MKLIPISLIFLVSCFSSLYGAARFNVSPGLIEFELAKVQTQSFMVSNTGSERVRLIFRPVYFEIDSRFLAAGHPIDSDKQVPDSLAPMLMISPKVLSLKPGQKRVVRTSLKPNQWGKDGDYRAHILIQTLGTKAAKNPAQSGQEKVQIKLTMALETAVAVYARKGKANTELSWSCQVNPQGLLELKVTNPSPWRYSGWLGLTDPKGVAKPIVTRLVSFRESKKVFLLNPPFPEKLEIRWAHNEDLEGGAQSHCRIQKPTPVMPKGLLQ